MAAGDAGDAVTAVLAAYKPFIQALVAFLVVRAGLERAGALYGHVFKTTFFVYIVWQCWSLSRDQSWLSRRLGGPDDDVTTLWIPTPCPELDTFYQVQMAYHIHSTVFSIILGAKWEMYLHHAVAIILIGTSDVLDLRRPGMAVFLVHDIPDIFGTIVKAALFLGNKTFLLTFYALLLAVWGYFRLFKFAQIVYDVFASTLPEDQKYVFGPLLLTLLVLHYFWYSLFLLMGYKFATRGKVKDLSEAKSQGGRFETPAPAAPADAAGKTPANTSASSPIKHAASGSTDAYVGTTATPGRSKRVKAHAD